MLFIVRATAAVVHRTLRMRVDDVIILRERNSAVGLLPSHVEPLGSLLLLIILLNASISFEYDAIYFVL